MAEVRICFAILIVFVSVVQNTEGMWTRVTKEGFFRVARVTFNIAKENKTPKLNVFMEEFNRTQEERKNDPSQKDMLGGKCVQPSWISDKIGGLWGVYTTPKNNHEDLTLLRQRFGVHLASLGTTVNFDNVRLDQQLPIQFRFLSKGDSTLAGADDEVECKLNKPSSDPESLEALAISDDVMKAEIPAGGRTEEEFREYLKTEFAKKFFVVQR